MAVSWELLLGGVSFMVDSSFRCTNVAKHIVHPVFLKYSAFLKGAATRTPPWLKCTPPFAYMYTPSGKLKFSLRITQLHTKFSRQFKGLHMILSNLSMTFPTALNSVNLA